MSESPRKSKLTAILLVSYPNGFITLFHSGESAFHSMMTGLGWAKNPMINRIPELRADIPITVLLGSRSWVKESSMEAIRWSRISSYVNLRVITGAGHHIYADKPEIFNKYVLEACAHYDQQTDDATESEHDQNAGD